MHDMQLVEIRSEEQKLQTAELLKEGFPHVRFDWSVAFKAPPGRNGHGLLMIADGRPQGGVLFFEKTQAIGGRERRVVNVSSWYIRPKYRRFAVRMMRAATADPDAVYTACSPIRSVQAICRRVGFRYLTHGSIVSVPLLNGFAAEPGVKVEAYDPALVEPAHRQWISDHASERFFAISIRRGERVVPVLWIRGLRIKELPAVRLIFTSDYDVLRAALPAVHRHMLLRHGVVGLHLPRVPPLEDLRSARRPNKGPSTIVKGDVADTDVNLLYSELFYLPSWRRSREPLVKRLLFKASGAPAAESGLRLPGSHHRVLNRQSSRSASHARRARCE